MEKEIRGNRIILREQREEDIPFAMQQHSKRGHVPLTAARP